MRVCSLWPLSVWDSLFACTYVYGIVEDEVKLKYSIELSLGIWYNSPVIFRISLQNIEYRCNKQLLQSKILEETYKNRITIDGVIFCLHPTSNIFRRIIVTLKHEHVFKPSYICTNSNPSWDSINNLKWRLSRYFLYFHVPKAKKIKNLIYAFNICRYVYRIVTSCICSCPIENNINYFQGQPEDW